MSVEQTSAGILEQTWARRAARLAQAVVQAEEGERIELVLIRWGDEVYGLEAQYVCDVWPIGPRSITRVPRTPAWVAGVVNLRGRILSALDLQRFLGLPQAPTPQAGAYLVVVETPEMQVVLLADEVLAVEALAASEIQDAAGTIRGIRPEYVRGVARYARPDADQLLVVLDVRALLADPSLVVHEEIM